MQKRSRSRARVTPRQLSAQRAGLSMQKQQIQTSCSRGGPSRGLVSAWHAVWQGLGLGLGWERAWHGPDN
eukprot:218023-Chlamydomonas_euryale.AAC.1